MAELHRPGRSKAAESGPLVYAHGLPRSGGALEEAAAPFLGRAPVSAELVEGLRRAHAEGRITEDHLLDLLGGYFGMRCIDLSEDPPDPELADLLDPGFCLGLQIVPWQLDQGVLIIATARPEGFAEMAARISFALREKHRLALRPVLAPRAAIQALVASRARTELTAAMSARVPLSESCRGWGQTGTRLLWLSGLGALAALLTLLFPHAAFLLLFAWATLTLIFAILLKTGAALAQLFHPPPPLLPRAEGPLPHISVLVPMFRERDIAGTLIANLQRLDYPRDRLDVLLCLEEADQVTQDTVAAIALPSWMRVVVVPRGAPQTKPRAMNYALDFCHGEIVGIFDAEDRPEPDQLYRVARRFADAPPEMVCLQGALDYFNSRQNWIARCFAIEYNSWFRLVLPGMEKLGLPIPLGGTTLYMRRNVLERIGRWDAHNVTEDADLGIRLARRGYRTEILDTTTWEEANCRAYPWVKQRSRWLKGYIVTYLVHMRRPVALLRDLGPWRFLGFQMHFTAAISQFLLAPLLWSSWLIVLGLPHPLSQHVAHSWLVALALLFFAAGAVNILLGLVATRGALHRHLWPWVPTISFYFPLGCLACYKAAWEMVVNPFYWDKTSHGHAQPKRKS
ncbi:MULTISPECIES: glycosyltransferase family 2 protein [Pseudooceanicola]|uniref:glycosyltransferase family 2 protein n=1 Tax=Pseudooceanicola TaxID=1679449 RepID=UPI002880AD49|nr:MULTISPECIES: glycosyltransferase [Pseudooceanicola]